MNRILFILILLSLFAACKKETSQPTADFTFGNNQTNEFLLGTTDTTILISSVQNATSVNWDLGDGRTSENSRMVLSYPRSGTYTVTLTAKAQNGIQTTVSKKVKVLDRVLKEINIKRIYWGLDPAYRDTFWPLTPNADVYFKILLPENNKEAYEIPYPRNAQEIYTSPVMRNVSSSGKESYTFTITKKIVLDKELLESRRYLISLIAKNASGEYWLWSNNASGSSQVIHSGKPSADRRIVVKLSSFSEIDMYLDYE